MTTEFTPFSAEHYERLGVFLDAIFPDYPGQLAEVRHEDATRAPHCKSARWVVLESDRIIGGAEYSQHAGRFHPGKFNVSVMVHPDREGAGLGGRLYEHLLRQLAPLEPIAFWAFVRDDCERAMRFAESRGFAEVQREIESHLDLEAYEPAIAQEREARLAEAGLLIRSLPELAGEPGFDEKLYALRWEVIEDVPSPIAPTRLPFAEWVEKYYGNPALLREAVFVALDGENFVGYSNLFDSEGSDVLYTGLTGVLRSHRGRGIAQALKHRALAWAKAAGRKTVMTWNEKANADILAINRKVGFEKRCAWINYVKELAAGDAANAGGTP